MKQIPTFRQRHLVFLIFKKKPKKTTESVIFRLYSIWQCLWNQLRRFLVFFLSIICRNTRCLFSELFYFMPFIACFNSFVAQLMLTMSSDNHVELTMFSDNHVELTMSSDNAFLISCQLILACNQVRFFVNTLRLVSLVLSFFGKVKYVQSYSRGDVSGELTSKNASTATQIKFFISSLYVCMVNVELIQFCGNTA